MVMAYGTKVAIIIQCLYIVFEARLCQVMHRIYVPYNYALGSCGNVAMASINSVHDTTLYKRR